MKEEIKYLTDEEFKAGKSGYWLAPFTVTTTPRKVKEHSENTGVDISEIDYLDTPTQATS